MVSPNARQQRDLGCPQEEFLHGNGFEFSDSFAVGEVCVCKSNEDSHGTQDH